MGRTRRNLPSIVAAGPKERHRRAQRSQYDRQAPVPHGFVAKPPMPKSKHHTYFEFVENKDKKKKLEFQVTIKKDPPPGFEFVPIGNPQLTSACKELSREKDAMIFIVSNSKDRDSTQLAYQVHRIGHHIRQAIVEEARATIQNLPHHVISMPDGEPEPIPESQEIYHAQADAAIRDLFPRIPNTDRQMIIEHAFTRGSSSKAEKPVGLSEDITLARRAQLAVLAHIRHAHTRYDELLKETTWQNARKVVEALCLDILVKWRGDEETGRDQLDEILREVVVISDSEDGSSDDGSTDDTSVDDSGNAGAATGSDLELPRVSGQSDAFRLAAEMEMSTPHAPTGFSTGRHHESHQRLAADKKAQRGFKRYRAWEEAIQRNRDQPQLSQYYSVDSNVSYGPQRSAFLTTSFATDSRIHSNNRGSAPGSNGYGPLQPLYMTSSRDSSRYDNPDRIIQHSQEKVMPDAVHDKFPSTASSSQQPASPFGSRFQDLLVRSIEPVSPNARPSFVRTLPPKSPGQMDPSLPRSNLHHRPGPGSHWEGGIPFEGNAHPDRGEMPLRPLQRDRLPDAFYVEPHRVPSPHSRDYNPMRLVDHGVPTSSAMTYSVPGFYEPDSPSERSLNRRIVVNATRPGERANPILMEDRGGFYERINVQPRQPNWDHSRQTHVIGESTAAMEAQGTLEHHGVATWEKGSNVVADRAGVEMISVSTSRTRIPNAGVRVTNDSFTPHVQDQAVRTELRQSFGEDPGSTYRPVLRAEPLAAPPPEGYWVIKRSHDHQPTAPPQYRDWVYRRPGDAHARRVDERYDARYPQHNQRFPDVIVLD